MSAWTLAFNLGKRAIVSAAALTMVVASVAAAPAPAANKGPPNAPQGFSQNRDQPVQIEAASLEVRDKDKVATFTGNVKVVQGDTTMRCKSLVVFYDGSAKPGGMKTTSTGSGSQQQISRLEAKGGVVVTQKDHTATGDTGLFDMHANTVTLLGNVMVSQGQNVMRGDRLVVDLTSGVSRVESGKSHGPVRMLIKQQPSNAQRDGGAAAPNAPKPGPQRPFSSN